MLLLFEKVPRRKKIMLKTNIIKYTNNKVTYHAYFQDILGIMFRYVKKNLNKKSKCYNNCTR